MLCSGSEPMSTLLLDRAGDEHSSKCATKWKLLWASPQVLSKKHLVKNRLKATLAPKSGESDMFFEKKSRNWVKFEVLVESVTTGLPVGDIFNDQILKLSPFMSHFDFGFSQPLLQRRFKKENPAQYATLNIMRWKKVKICRFGPADLLSL